MPNKKLDFEWMKADYEILAKACNYLLLANGAGLATYLTSFKEFSALPAFKGSGVIVSVLALGLTAAAIGYAVISISWSGALDSARSGKLGDGDLSYWEYSIYGILALSFAFFLLGLWMAAFRFYWL